MSDETGLVVPIPPDIDEYDPEEAYLTGCKVMADLFSNAADTYRAALSESVGADEADDDACPECGNDLLPSMGADETTTPAGAVCPECEL